MKMSDPGSRYQHKGKQSLLDNILYCETLAHHVCIIKYRKAYEEQLYWKLKHLTD